MPGNGEAVRFGPKVYINGFPKSGTHLAERLACTIGGGLAIQKDDGKVNHWLGTFDRHSWSTHWLDVDVVCDVIGQQRPGTFIKGHLGYHPDLEAAMQANGTACYFVYRDLRDVAVSQTYHIEMATNDKPGWKHPGQALYLALPDHEARLLAVIEGLGEYPGLFERWALYAPWLDVGWVFPLRFEYALADPGWMARLFIEYAMRRVMEHEGLIAQWGEAYAAGLIQQVVTQFAPKAVEEMGHKEKSPTFRRGIAGGWREEFTPRVTDCFKAHAGDWLQRLGYEDGEW